MCNSYEYYLFVFKNAARAAVEENAEQDPFD